jgi:hypothetical protein
VTAPGDIDPVDFALFGVELLNVLRQIRDQLQTIGDRIAELTEQEDE